MKVTPLDQLAPGLTDEQQREADSLLILIQINPGKRFKVEGFPGPLAAEQLSRYLCQFTAGEVMVERVDDWFKVSVSQAALGRELREAVSVFAEEARREERARVRPLLERSLDAAERGRHISLAEGLHEEIQRCGAPSVNLESQVATLAQRLIDLELRIDGLDRWGRE